MRRSSIIARVGVRIAIGCAILGIGCEGQLVSDGIAGSGLEATSCEDDLADDVCEVWRLVNEERANAGVDPVAWDASLAAAAQLHAEDMVAQDYFDHDSLDGRNFATRARDSGYSSCPRGENIAAGQRSPAAVMTAWMNSDGHRRNILSSGSDELGVGLHQNHWVQVFGLSTCR